MTANHFTVLCLAVGIDPDIALENEDILQALRNRDEEEVKRILEEEF